LITSEGGGGTNALGSSVELERLKRNSQAIIHEVLTPEQASVKIAQHNGEIAISFEIIDEEIVRYAVAISSEEVLLVESDQMGQWSQDPDIQKIAHDAKSLARINGLVGVSFDVSLAAYLVNPGVRTQEFIDIAQRWADVSRIDESSSQMYLITSASVLFDLKHALAQELHDRGLMELFLTMEMPVAALLARMENVGIAVNKNELEFPRRS
jgi:DNA polymerase-1